MKGTKHLTALAATAFLGVSFLGALPAQALMYNFSYSGTGVTASGVFDVNAGSITNIINGTYTSSSSGLTNAAITLLAPNGFQGNDNLLSPTNPFLTLSGFSFDVAGLPSGQHVNVFYDASNVAGVCSLCFVNLEGPDTVGAGTNTLTQVTFSVTPVPLPAAAWLLASGLIGLVGIGRRRRAA